LPQKAKAQQIANLPKARSSASAIMRRRVRKSSQPSGGLAWAFGS
jgi:hypothetical protein